MKRTNKSVLRTAILYIAGLTLLTACGKDTDGFLPDAPTKGLTVTTHVNDYLPEGAETGSRASTSGNSFSFTSGDAIGLIGLKNGNVISEHNNVKLTYSGNGRWNSEPLYDYGATSYIAYYPYRSDMSGKTSVDAIKNAFPIQSDQSTEANFNASNLLTATATLNGSSLKFNFTPAFAMVEVTVPDEVNATASIAGKAYTYKIYGSSSATYASANPLFRKDKILRRIIKPSVSTEIKITCNVEDIPCVTYTKNVNIGQGNYKKLILNGKINRNLAVGDLVYNEGGVITFYTGSATAAPKANCVGAIYQLGTAPGDAASNYDGKVPTIHGYVIAVRPTATEYVWGPTKIDLGNTNVEQYGIICTKNIKNTPGYSSSTYPACWHACNYTPSAPGDTSGWFFPSYKDFQFLINNSEAVKSGLSKAGGNFIGVGVSGQIWTSTEYKGTNVSFAFYLNSLVFDKYGKDKTRVVWPCFAF